MRNWVTVLTSLLSVEFVVYTVCLCSPKWLVQMGEVTSQGLFSLCSNFQGYSTCTTFPPWVGSYSLSWMFLAGSSALSLASLLTCRLRGSIAALLLNITSVPLCAGALIVFVVSIEEQYPELFKYLGWTFYICCANLLYAVVVSVVMGVLHGDSTRVQPTLAGPGVDLPVIAP